MAVFHDDDVTASMKAVDSLNPDTRERLRKHTAANRRKVSAPIGTLLPWID
jgi:hypothetical protein